MTRLIHSRRRVLGYGAAGVAALGMPSIARAQPQLVRIGLPTKTYYPTIIAETALRQKLFDKEGIKAELTIYRGGAECYEALAAGAADVMPTFLPARSFASLIGESVFTTRCQP